MPGKLLLRGMLLPKMSHSIVPSVRLTPSSQMLPRANNAALPFASVSHRAVTLSAIFAPIPSDTFFKSGTIASAPKVRGISKHAIEARMSDWTMVADIHFRRVGENEFFMDFEFESPNNTRSVSNFDGHSGSYVGPRFSLIDNPSVEELNSTVSMPCK